MSNSKYETKIKFTEEDLYNMLSDDEKKRFNRLIINDVRRTNDMGVEIICAVVNDVLIVQ